jgi:hypothetical protein
LSWTRCIYDHSVCLHCLEPGPSPPSTRPSPAGPPSQEAPVKRVQAHSMTMTIFTEANKFGRWPPIGLRSGLLEGLALRCAASSDCSATQCQTPRETDSRARWRTYSDLSWPRGIYDHSVCLHCLEPGPSTPSTPGSLALRHCVALHFEDVAQRSGPPMAHVSAQVDAPGKPRSPGPPSQEAPTEPWCEGPTRRWGRRARRHPRLQRATRQPAPAGRCRTVAASPTSRGGASERGQTTLNMLL